MAGRERGHARRGGFADLCSPGWARSVGARQSPGPIRSIPSPASPAAIAGTVPPADSSALRKRVLSALILVPVTLGAVWYGAPVWDMVVGIMGALMAWEWARLCGGGRLSYVGWTTVLIAPIVVAVGAVAGILAGMAVIGVGTLIIGI